MFETGREFPCRFLLYFVGKNRQNLGVCFSYEQEKHKDQDKESNNPSGIHSDNILSAFYKFVLKGSGDFSISAFKNGR